MSDALRAARDPNTLPERLVLLSTHDEGEVQEAVAGNPATPFDVLKTLGARFPAGMVRNPQLPLLALSDPGALASLPIETAMALLREPTSPLWLIESVAQNRTIPLRERLQMARAEGASDRLLLGLLSCDEGLVGVAISSRPRLSADLESGLLASGSVDIRIRMASRPDLSARGLDLLRQDSSPLVRLVVDAATRTATLEEPLLWPHGLATDTGDRAHNEDAAAVVPLSGGLLAMVADGMGGSSSGDVASRSAVEVVPRSLARLLPRLRREERGQAVLVAICEANLAICEASAVPQHTGIGSTVAAVLLDDDRAFIAHSGDSRVYRLRAGRLEALTRDHSLLNECLSKIPSLTEEQIATLPRNVITRALGINASGANPDLREETLAPGDVLALCTDGVFADVPEEMLVEALADARDDPARAARALVAARGRVQGGNRSRDNATAVVVVVP